jgi:peroxiredoxin Q/BCP
MIEDADYTISTAFGVAQRFGGVEHTTFVIDADGTVIKVYPKVKARGHAAAVLRDCGDVWGRATGARTTPR